MALHCGDPGKPVANKNVVKTACMIIFPRHPVIPPEVFGVFLYVFGGPSIPNLRFGGVLDVSTVYDLGQTTISENRVSNHFFTSRSPQKKQQHTVPSSSSSLYIWNQGSIVT